MREYLAEVSVLRFTDDIVCNALSSESSSPFLGGSTTITSDPSNHEIGSCPGTRTSMNYKLYPHPCQNKRRVEMKINGKERAGMQDGGDLRVMGYHLGS